MIDSLVRVVNPEGIAFELHPAGIVPRMTAFLLDLLVQFAVLIGVLLVFAALKITGVWLSVLTTFVITWFYFVICEMCMNGKSLGKLALGIRCVMRDGSPETLPASLLRNFLRFPEYFMILGLFVPLFSGGFRRLGDITAGTLVVYNSDRLSKIRAASDPAIPRPPERVLSPEAAFAALEFARRRPRLGVALQRELAEMALAVYLGEAPVEDPVEAMRSVASWYAGNRKETRGS